MLTHKGTQRIQTERLILRRFTMNDTDDIFRNYASDDEVTRFLSFSSHQSIDDTKSVVNKWLEQFCSSIS
jgi:ribosomal-protein-alanine N-acetyltransferase